MLQPSDIKVLNIAASQRLSADGQPTKVYRISYLIRGKIQDLIEVPESEYTAAHARDLIAKQASVHVELLDG